jgi:hypothetical protein
MRLALATLILAAGISLVWSGNAVAIPASGTAMKGTMMSVSAVQQAHYSKYRHRHGVLGYYERRTRHGITKCYREFVIGPYVCRTYRYR